MFWPLAQSKRAQAAPEIIATADCAAQRSVSSKRCITASRQASFLVTPTSAFSHIARSALTSKHHFFTDNLAMPQKNMFSSLDALKYASIASSEVERVRLAMASLDSIATRQVRAFDSISSAAKLQKEALERMDSVARQTRDFESMDDLATRQVRAALESVRHAGLSSQIHRDWEISLELAKQLDWTKNLVSKSLISSSVQDQLPAYQAREATAIADHLRTLSRINEMVPKNALEQLLGSTSRSWEQLMPTGSLAVKDLLGSLASQLHRSEWQVALAAMGSGAELQSQVEVAVDGVANAVAAGAEQTVQEVLRQLIAVIQTFEPAVQIVLVVLYNPLFLVLLTLVLTPVCDVYLTPWMQERKDKRAVAKKIKAYAIAEVGSSALLSDSRFVGTETLAVRSNASLGAPRVGELHFGQAVRIADKKKDFTLVAWSSEDGSTLVRGWIPSRYLKSFS
jgi:Bacterial SH3 domain